MNRRQVDMAVGQVYQDRVRMGRMIRWDLYISSEIFVSDEHGNREPGFQAFKGRSSFV